jgi:peptidoglycan/LPS O-acetylase OafA/YrhL
MMSVTEATMSSVLPEQLTRGLERREIPILNGLRAIAVLFVVTAILTLWAYRLVLVFAGVHSGYIYEAFDTRADHLLIGCMLAFLLFGKRWIPFIRFACRPWVVIAAALILTVLCALELRYGATFRDTVAFTVEPVLVAMLIPGLINATASLAVTILAALFSYQLVERPFLRLKSRFQSVGKPVSVTAQC